jgi:hypothetical protein
MKMMMTRMTILLFIGDGSLVAVGLPGSCGNSSSGQRSRTVTPGSTVIAAMLFAHANDLALASPGRIRTDRSGDASRDPGKVQHRGRHSRGLLSAV